MSAFTQAGESVAEVRAALKAVRADDVDPSDGKVLSGLYELGDDAKQLARDAYQEFLTQNAIYVNFYPSINRMEKDVVRAVADLCNGDDAVVGNITSGGTESIMMAVKASRDRARAERPEVTEPEMIVPISAHPAFHKAAHYLGVRPIVTEIDTTTYRADVDAVRAAVSDSTILVVGSAPTYSHGVVDPIAELAAVAVDAGAYAHVDGCVGAIPLGLMRGLGEPVPDFGFDVPGVTTISADLHKYGYVPKNASVVLYRDAAMRRSAWFVSSGTTEYAVINPTVQSSRSGGPTAAAWALFRHLGEEGFRQLTADVLACTRAMIDGVGGIDDIDVLGDPVMTMFTMASDTINVFSLDDAMRRRGWSLLPEFAAGGGPANLHVQVSWANVGHEDAFVADLSDAVAEVREDPGFDEEALVAAVVEVRDAEPMEIFTVVAPLVGLDGDELPEDTARLNTAMNLLPADTRDELLTDFANLMW